MADNKIQPRYKRAALDIETYDKLKLLAKSRGITVKRAIEMLLEEYLKNNYQ